MIEAAPSAAPECYEPRGGEGVGAPDDLIIDPRTYLMSLRRVDFQDLKLRWIFFPSLDAPVLRFPTESIGRAAVLQSLIDEQKVRYLRTADATKRIAVASRARRMHHLRVSLACGYSWPGNDPRVVLEFSR